MLENGYEIIVLSDKEEITSKGCLKRLFYAPSLSMIEGSDYCIKCGKCGAQETVLVGERILTERRGARELGFLTLKVVVSVLYNVSTPSECTEASELINKYPSPQ